jgi:hypothetical protein
MHCQLDISPLTNKQIKIKIKMTCRSNGIRSTVIGKLVFPANGLLDKRRIYTNDFRPKIFVEIKIMFR